MGKLLGNKKILMGAGGAVVFVLLFMFVLKPMFFGGSDPAAPAEGDSAVAAGNAHGAASEGSGAAAGGEAPAAGAAAQTKPGPTVKLPVRIHNLFGVPRHYVKLAVALEFEPHDPKFFTLAGEARVVAEEEFALEVAPVVPLIEDAITGVVASKSIEQISTPAGRDALKRELLAALSEIVHEPVLINVYFTEFLTQ